MSRLHLFSIVALTAILSTIALPESRADETSDGWEKLREFVTRRGGVDSGGGDGFVEDYLSHARLAVRLAKPRWNFPDVPFRELELLLMTTKVEMVHEILKDRHGHEKDALNFPKEGKILVSRLRWKELDATQKLVLTLHEFLGILGIPDASFENSHRLLKREASELTAPIESSDVRDTRASEEHVMIPSENCPGRDERARLHELVREVWDLNKQNELRFKKLLETTSEMISQLRMLGSEKVRLSPDPVPQLEEFVISLNTYGYLTGLEAMEQELTRKFPAECKSGVARAMRMFLAVSKQDTADARIALEVWKESLKTLVRFMKEQDLKPPHRSFHRSNLIFMFETMRDHLQTATHSYSNVNTSMFSLSISFHAAD